ncbi:MAG TPA: 3-dehydroquinate synthase [Aeromicrobium sp.]|nr:3-dehydroquinate synthase [Aeromicrobium sp.]
MTTRVKVNAAAPYEVVVGHGVTNELRGLLDGAARVAIIHPPTLRERAERLRAGIVTDERAVHLLEVPDGEAAKSAGVLTFCWDVLGKAGLTRSDVVVGLGGGSTTDLAGFVAASWLRGVAFVNLPTTVLGMVDAAVGGKTGINTEAGKNLVGAFHEPAGVLCDLDVLGSLSPAELRSGMAEVAKCGFIADPTILELIEAAGTALLDPGSALLAELITKGIAVKAATVEQDLKETAGAAGNNIGREALNYGHTLGHALERVQRFGVRHGEAISVGMVFAAELAHRTGTIDDALLARHRRILHLLGLPTTTTVAFAPLLDAMRVDKKARGNTLRFVVLDGLAHPVILSGPDDLVLRDAHAALAP